MLLGRVGFGREQRAAGAVALGRERGRVGGSFGASGIWESKGRGKKGGAAWILDLGEENGLGFLTVFVG